MEYLKKFFKYKGLIQELVARDLKVKYRRSFLGYIWTILSPLLMMIVVSIVFSYLFRYEIANYTVYLLSGQILFGFFSEATTNAMSSVISNRALLSKVSVPKYMFPLSRTISAFVNLIFALIAIVFMLIITRAEIHLTLFLFFLPLIYLFFVALGVGLILATLAVFFRDILHIYSVLITALMYFTPIFYPVTILPEYALKLMNLNPLYHIIEMFRSHVMYGQLSSLRTHIICAAMSTVLMVAGLLFFKRNQDKFVMYI